MRMQLNWLVPVFAIATGGSAYPSDVLRALDLEPPGRQVATGLLADRLIGEYPKESEDSIYLVLRGVLENKAGPVSRQSVFAFPIDTEGNIHLLQGVTKDGRLGIANYSAKSDSQGRFSVKTHVSSALGDRQLAGYRAGILEGSGPTDWKPVLLTRIGSEALKLQPGGPKTFIVNLGKVSLRRAALP